MLVEASRYAVFPAAVLAGAGVPYPEDLYQEISKPHARPECYEPHALDEICLYERLEQKVVDSRVVLGEPPKKSEALAFHASFADSHSLPVNIGHSPELCKQFIAEVAREAESRGQPLGVAELLGIGLRVANNDLTQAVTTIAVATRHMARGQDSRLLPNVPVTSGMLVDWRKCAADYVFIDNDPDPVGDVYHFYGGMLVGIARGGGVGRSTFYEERTGKICDYIVKKIEPATNLLRYQLFGHEGETHVTDRIGYEMGRALAYVAQENGGVK